MVCGRRCLVGARGPLWVRPVAAGTRDTWTHTLPSRRSLLISADMGLWVGATGCRGSHSTCVGKSGPVSARAGCGLRLEGRQ